MINIAKGIIAGLVASSAIMGAVFLGSLIGLVPAADPVDAASGIVLSPMERSWIVHFAVGTFLWGPLLAVLSPILPSPFWFKGVVFGFFAWLVMILVVWASDPATPPKLDIEPLVIHLFFGAIVGWMYGVLLDATEREASNPRAARRGR